MTLDEGVESMLLDTHSILPLCTPPDCLLSGKKSKKMVLLSPSPGQTAVKIHPVVLFSICDAYIRRNDKQERVIGTLLGGTNAEGVVEVKDVYVVPHNESSDQVRQPPRLLNKPGCTSVRARCPCRGSFPTSWISTVILWNQVTKGS